jgi:4-amino-4-deoxy-L-arabinose transferase-like glycosyltransferase
MGRWTIGRLLLLCGFLYLGTAGGHFGSTDEEDLYHNTAILSSLLLPSEGAAPTSQAGALTRGPQEAGQSLLALPWYWLGQALAAQLPGRWQAYLVRALMTTFNIAITLLTIAALYRCGRALASEQAALLTAALYGLTTLAWPYSQTFYREPLVALCLLLAFWAAWRYQLSTLRADLLVALGAMFMAVSTKMAAVIAAPWFLLLLLPADRLRRREMVKGMALILLLVTVTALTVLPAKAATLLAYTQEVQHDLHHDWPAMARYGLHGLLSSPGKGLLVTAPTVLLGFAGLRPFYRRHRRLALAIVGLSLSFLLFNATRRGWHGGASWGPRYLLPVLPLLLLPAATLLERLGQRPLRTVPATAIAALALCGIAVQLVAVSIFHQNFYQTKIRQGVVSGQSLDGGRTYLEELHFQPAHSPLWGQAQLLWERGSRLLQEGPPTPITALPATPNELWRHFIALDSLDFWWLHLLMEQRIHSPLDP